jgi:hypothetical protein
MATTRGSGFPMAACTGLQCLQSPLAVFFSSCITRHGSAKMMVRRCGSHRRPLWRPERIRCWRAGHTRVHQRCIWSEVTKQRGADQPIPRRTKFGHGTFCGVRGAVRLGLQLPSIFRRRRRFFGGFGLGVAQPRCRAAAPGGGAGGSAPSAPAIFAQLLGGRGPLGLPGGPNGPKICLFALGS